MGYWNRLVSLWYHQTVDDPNWPLFFSLMEIFFYVHVLSSVICSSNQILIIQSSWSLFDGMADLFSYSVCPCDFTPTSDFCLVPVGCDVTGVLAKSCPLIGYVSAVHWLTFSAVHWLVRSKLHIDWLFQLSIDWLCQSYILIGYVRGSILNCYVRAAYWLIVFKLSVALICYTYCHIYVKTAAICHLIPSRM